MMNKNAKKIIKSKKTQKPRAGRPTKYPTINLNVLTKLVELGETHERIAKTLKISEDSLYVYKKKKEFSEAIKKGEELRNTKVEHSLFERATGYQHEDIDIKVIQNQIIKTKTIKHYPPDPVSMIFFLKNRKPEDWKDRVEHGGKDGGPVEVLLKVVYDDKPQPA